MHQYYIHAYMHTCIQAEGYRWRGTRMETAMLFRIQGPFNSDLRHDDVRVLPLQA